MALLGKLENRGCSWLSSKRRVLVLQGIALQEMACSNGCFLVLQGMAGDGERRERDGEEF